MQSRELKKWMRGQLEKHYKIGGTGNNYRAIANKNGKLEWHYIDAQGNSKGKVKEQYLIDGLNTTNPDGLNKNRYKKYTACLLYTSPSPRDLSTSRMPSSA